MTLAYRSLLASWNEYPGPAGMVSERLRKGPTRTGGCRYKCECSTGRTVQGTGKGCLILRFEKI